jgi:hypothetical protein
VKKTPKKGNSAQRAWAVVQGATMGEGARPPELEAIRVNRVLLARGYSQVQANEWWNITNPNLGGKTPTQVWLSEELVTPATVEKDRQAALMVVLRTS